MDKPCLKDEFDDIISDYPLNSKIEKSDGIHTLFDKTCDLCGNFGVQIIGTVEDEKIVSIATPTIGSCGKDQILRIRKN